MRDYMTLQVEALEADQSLLDAVLLLRKSRFRHIPVLDQGRLAGVITERDLWRFSPTMLIPLSQKDYNRISFFRLKIMTPFIAFYFDIGFNISRKHHTISGLPIHCFG